MKDQVDGLRECGYAAAALYSGMPLNDVRKTEAEIANRRYRLVFVAPERLLTPRFLQLMERLEVRAFAVDEAHCISHWGHDFRPEYRRLAEIKTRFPQASVHAYTATATERVRADIVEQLGLQNPAVLVGTFDRPNLVYRIIPRVDGKGQVIEALRRHPSEAAIVYCISRRDTEAMAEALQANRLRAAFYHAGMEADERRRIQDAFAAEDIDVVVATVAFGMGIDRSNVRYVIHAAMPKSIEHYQQETGRAGRDGLEAECVLLYSAADVLRWESLIEKSAAESNAVTEIIAASRELLEHMRRLCTGVHCRHRKLSEYFGQEYPKPTCEACDVCRNEVEGIADATATAQKILSCVARAGERFGAEHIVDVLLGANTERVRRWRHEQLTTYGLMKGINRKALTNMLYQLLDDGLLDRTAEERRFCGLTIRRGPYCAVNAPCASCSQKRRSARTDFTRSRGRASTVVCSIAFGPYGENSPWSGACPPMSCSATPRCATWHGSGRDRRLRCSIFAASGNANWPTSDSASSNVSRPTVVPTTCRWTQLSAAGPVVGQRASR